MELLFLGTGAADWGPVHKSPDKLYRRVSSALVNSDLLIDPGPSIYEFAEDNGTPDLYKKVENIILTHSHRDHFNTDTLLRLTAESEKTVHFYADAEVCARVAALSAEGVKLPVLHPLTPFKSEKVGAYDVLPCYANHGDLASPTEIPLNYIVSDGERCFFYGTDSGWLMYPTYKAIKRNKPNALIFECTTGYAPGDERIFGHTSAAMIGIMMESIIAQKATAPDCRYYTTHMARTLHGTHEDTVALLAPYGVTPAYDGLKIEI